MTNRVSGSVKFFNEARGYGFIKPSDNSLATPMHKLRGDILATGAMLFLVAILLWSMP